MRLKLQVREGDPTEVRVGGPPDVMEGSPQKLEKGDFEVREGGPLKLGNGTSENGRFLIWHSDPDTYQNVDLQNWIRSKRKGFMLDSMIDDNFQIKIVFLKHQK